MIKQKRRAKARVLWWWSDRVGCRISLVLCSFYIRRGRKNCNESHNSTRMRDCEALSSDRHCMSVSARFWLGIKLHKHLTWNAHILNWPSISTLLGFSWCLKLNKIWCAIFPKKDKRSIKWQNSQDCTLNNLNHRRILLKSSLNLKILILKIALAFTLPLVRHDVPFAVFLLINKHFLQALNQQPILGDFYLLSIEKVSFSCFCKLPA